ncbi:MAG TPA: DUF4012 domain-containing protein [Dehalococcoidia bacterium]|nr:DUF4012 domain-containing protein [Dehalococcoidia bacterium]
MPVWNSTGMERVRQALAGRRRAVAVARAGAITVLFVVVVRDALAAGHEVQVAEQQAADVLHGDLSPAAHLQVRTAGRRLNDAAGRLRRDRLLLLPATPVLRLAGWIPIVGRPLAEAPDLLALGADVASGGTRLARGLDPLIAETQAGAGPNAPPPAVRLVSALDAGEPALRAAARDLHRAQARRAKLHPDTYRGPFRGFAARLAEFDAVVPPVARQADALALLPAAMRALLGFNGPRTYLLIGQDSAEIRPTGGFIGSAGLITLDRGDLVYQEYRSSYDFDAPDLQPLPAPAPLQQYLGAPIWSLRDANWSPDFPTTARQLITFVQRDLGVTPDGVIAFDNDAVSQILAALGPLSVPGFAQPLTAQSWFDQTTQALITGPGSLLSQLQNANAAKGLGLSAVLKAVLVAVERSSGDQQSRALQALRTAARGGDVQIYAPEPAAAAWARSTEVDGGRTPPGGDALAVVDANLSYTKIGPYIDRALAYEVWLAADGSAQRAELRLTYHNGATNALIADPAKRLLGAQWLPSQGRFEAAPGLFGDYLRLLVPPGSILRSIDGSPAAPDVGDADGFRSIGLFLPLGAQQTQTLSFALAPAFRPAAGDYQLTVFRQPGVPAFPLHIVVHLPNGNAAVAVSSGGAVQGESVVWDTTLAATRTFSLRLVRR